MIKVQGYKLTRPGGFVVQHVDVETAFGNLLNGILAAMRGPTRMSRLTVADVETFSKEGLSDAVAFTNLTPEVVDAAIKASDDVRKFFDGRRRLEGLTGPQQAVFVRLLQPAREVIDFGAETLNDLASASIVDSSFFAGPSTGFARPMLKVAGVPELKEDGACMAALSPGSPFAGRVASALMLFDRPSISPRILPSVESPIDGHSSRMQPFGSLIAVEHQLRAAHAMCVLYRVQASLMHLHINHPLFLVAYAVLWDLSPELRPGLVALKEQREAMLQLPLHPVLRFLSTSFVKGTADTAFGDAKELYWAWGAGRDAETEAQAAANGDYDPRNLLLREAFNSLTGAQTALGGKRRNSVEWDFTEETGLLTVSRLARALAGATDIIKHWRTLQTVLGWTAATTGKAVHLDLQCAEITWCNGDAYSQDPTKSLLGLSPCYPANVTSRTAFVPELTKHFDGDSAAATTQAWVVTIPGVLPIRDDGEHLLQIVMPGGAWMGEPNVETVRSLTAGGGNIERLDLLGDAVVAFWGANAPAYAGFYYDADVPALDDPKLGPVKEGAAVRTSWVPYAIGESADDATTSLIRALGSDALPVKEVDWMFRRNAHFLQRVPIASAITTDPVWIDPLSGASYTLRGTRTLINDVAEVPTIGAAALSMLATLVKSAPIETSVPALDQALAAPAAPHVDPTDLISGVPAAGAGSS